MMGKDVERIVAEIDGVKDALVAGIQFLCTNSNYQIQTEGVHGEAEIPVPGSGFMIAAMTALSNMEADIGKMDELKAGLYTSANSFNNSYGSPWTELNSLKAAVTTANNFDVVNFMGDRLCLLGHMQIALSRAVDAKWAMTIYHDYIQRGFDNKFNNNEPSIKFNAGINRESTGNLKQEYSENVNIPKESIDPF